MDPVTRVEVVESAFDKAFSKKQCLNCWAKVGVAPLRRKCLENKLVHQELEDAEDSMNKLMAELEFANDYNTYYLTISCRMVSMTMLCEFG